MSFLKSDHSSEAVVAVNRTLSTFRDDDRGHHGRQSPRLSITAAGLADDRAQAAVLRCVSIAEHFVVSLFVEVTEDRLPLTDPKVMSLWDATASALTERWPDRLRTWKAIHGIDFSQSGGLWPRLEAYVLARNLIAHGLGHLTLKQKRGSNSKADALKRLGLVGISVVGDRVVLSSSHVEDCATLVKDLVEWLDGQMS